MLIDFTEVEKAIESIAVSCPDSAKEAKDLLSQAVQVSCKADASKKDDLFKEIEEAIAQGRIDCPSKLKEYETIESFYKDSSSVKCSG